MREVSRRARVGNFLTRSSASSTTTSSTRRISAAPAVGALRLRGDQGCLRDFARVGSLRCRPLRAQHPWLHPVPHGRGAFRSAAGGVAARSAWGGIQALRMVCLSVVPTASRLARVMQRPRCSCDSLLSWRSEARNMLVAISIAPRARVHTACCLAQAVQPPPPQLALRSEPSTPPPCHVS